MPDPKAFEYRVLDELFFRERKQQAYLEGMEAAKDECSRPSPGSHHGGVKYINPGELAKKEQSLKEAFERTNVTEEFTQELGRLSREGWEVVSAIPSGSGANVGIHGGGGNFRVLLRRAV